MDSPARPGCFTRQQRLLKPAEFKRVFADACKVGNQYLTLLAKENELNHPRLGLAIAKKHVKTAVGRNRIKRQVRESFRLHQEDLGGFDIIVLSRVGCNQADPRELRASLDTLWLKLVKRCAQSSSS